MNRASLLIGGFIVGGLVLTAAAIVWLSGTHLFGRQTEAVIYFQDGVSGLYVGAPVTFRGVPVGQVESIGLEFDNKTLTERTPVNVYLSRQVVTYHDGSDSPPSLEALVQRGLRAKLVMQSFVTGQRSIELNIFPGAAPVRPVTGKRPEIPAVPNRLDVLLGQLAGLPIPEIAADLRSTLQATQATMDSVRVAMGSVRSSLDVTGREVDGLGTEARATLAAAQSAILHLQARSDSTLSSIARLADTANSAAGDIRPELVRAIGKAEGAADAAELAMRRLADVAAPDSPTRTDMESAMADAARAARSLRGWSELVVEQPNAVIFGRRQP